MKQNLVFNYDFLFADHFSRVSDQAKLYYIKLMFYAHNGFVANPLSVLDSMGYDKSVLEELVANEDILRLPSRCEVFITSYFLHTHFNPMTWRSSPFYIYWQKKLYLKKNGVFTFKKPDTDDLETNETSVQNDTTVEEPVNYDDGITFQKMFNVEFWCDLTDEQKRQWRQYVEEHYEKRKH